MAPRPLAFVTYDKHPDGADDDQLAFPALRDLGYEVHTPIWNDPAVDWKAYDALIIRSCWDYYTQIDDFRAWLDRLESIGAHVLNPLPIIRWNMDKVYLREIMERGAPVIPAVWLRQGETAQLAHLMDANGWDQAVMKPTISAGAYQTLVVDRADAAAQQPGFEAMLSNVGVIVQKFLPEIRTDGEWSFFFFNNQFSHAIIKRPNPGDFRIQGGTIESVIPSSDALEQARQALAFVDAPLLYARVDGLLITDTLHLMELELIEPRLYLKWGDGAPERFAQAIDRALAT